MATVTERGGRWFVRVRKNGVSKGKTCKTQAQAIKWGREKEAEIGKAGYGGLITAHGKTVAGMIDCYMLEIAPLKPFGRTKRYFLQKLRDEMGGLPLAKLTSVVVVDYARGRARGGAGPVTVNMEISYLSGVLRIARAV